jgi:hypothetical protein
MTQQVTFNVSVLILREGDSWVAQGLEYDIAAQGKTIAAAKTAFERTFVGQIVVDVLHGKQPLEGVSRAPRSYWTKFEHGERLTDRKPFYLPEGIPPSFMIAAAAEDLRICA